ncbi:MAG TPA: glycosyltransferase [Xanthobacteraceae bacterium]|nr:glycosyltransferase [Xanthobacteraceae bacterium]
MVRICHIITDLDAGGAERALSTLISHLDPSCFRNEVISLIRPGVFGDDLRRAGIPVISLDLPRGRPTLSGFLKAVNYLRQSRPAILQTWLYHADLFGSFAHYFTPSARLLWNVRCSDIASLPESYQLRWVIGSLARLSRRPDAVIVNSKRGKLFHEKNGYRPRRWIEIPNGVDTQRFRPLPLQRDQLRSSMGIRAKGPVIGLVARYHPMKDHPTFLQAAAKFANDYPGACFVLCGTGCDGQNKNLNRWISQAGLSDHVTLLGTRTDMENIYPAFDLTTLCSAFGEGFPNVLTEAMACGVPCVATDVGACREILEEEWLVVQPRDPDALVRAWKSALAGPTEVLARKARTRACERYGIEQISKLYESLYLDVASRNGEVR